MRTPVEWTDVPSIPISDGHIDYSVHLKYVRQIASLTKNLSATTSLEPCIGRAALNQLSPKIRLLDRTRMSLVEELRSIDDDAEYAHACVAWLPAKVYYNLYHLLSIIEYMIAGDKSLLGISHANCLKNLAHRIGDGLIRFNNPLLNFSHDKSILNFSSRSGEVLSSGISDETILSLIMKKVARDKLDEIQCRKKINRRTVKGRKIYESEMNKLKISIVDFFYSMRIRTNYKDMSFIDEVEPELARTYFIEYYNAADNFYGCFNELKNQFIRQISQE